MRASIVVFCVLCLQTRTPVFSGMNGLEEVRVRICICIAVRVRIALGVCRRFVRPTAGI